MNEVMEKSVCIAGAGPGGALLGLLLARAGIDVVVLEKSKDFEREFRGESLSPDARKLLEEIGLKDYMEEHGYLESRYLGLYENNERLMRMDLGEVDKDNHAIIEFPQPVLLSALINEAKKFPNYDIRMGVSAKELIKEDGKIVGVEVGNTEQSYTIRTKLVVAADGRYSRLRKMSGLSANIEPVSRDVSWFMIPRPANWDPEIKVKLKGDRHMILLPTYPDKIRAGINIPKGKYKEFRNQGIENLYNFVEELEPALGSVVRESVKDWSELALLDIFTAEVPQWSLDGFVLMGDSAHTITPIMGQGIKHALFDARKLSGVVIECLKNNPDTVIDHHHFLEYQTERKKSVTETLRFQKRQERMFLLSGRAKALGRRTFYRILNSLSFAKQRIMKKIYYGGIEAI
ncbi:FAD binding domain protein [Teredinibacter turnerae T7901]|uniref:FAD binding domain protein n=1 Tax=Teredinibacter turnerae (strain ATCC 39867 / T7901) TaxID=377629 RepID=C5BKB1_TERTT|nr:FAD-dependent oxidoreductase [Teredinibacter turnerae]ACR14467.1 FAD binding domain protein [Teredinibacter turnerae T7901]